MKDRISNNKEGQVENMKSYYAFQAKIYDATRWTFLYGRNAILKKLPLDRFKPVEILEVGCGTGVNLEKLAKMYPNAKLTGMDVSGDMLNVATKRLEKLGDRVTLLEEPYGANEKFNGKFDAILFSYALTMINPQWEELLAQTPKDLKENGIVAVVDFHDANFEFYRQFMRGNHVKLDGHILPVLEQNFTPLVSQVRKGLLGVWDYMLFIGMKK
jgi:S-adenosylmethionine-diacylgycerolhomoserine-N-methlytransferase